MTLAKIEESVLQALDDGHEPTLEAYAEFANYHIDMCKLGESLCLAIIETDSIQWQQLMGQCLRTGAPELGEALAKIALHIDAHRQPFVSAQAMRISDLAEHDAYCVADLNRDLNQGRD